MSPHWRMRICLLRVTSGLQKNSIASSVYPGATTHSTNVLMISAAVSLSTLRLNAMTEPKAALGSQSRAFT